MTGNAEDRESGILSPADALRAAMEERGWSQSDLAYVLGVRSATVSQILTGKRGISSEMAKALAVAFDKPAATFARVQAEWDLHKAEDPDPRMKARARVQAEYPLREMIKRGWISEECTGEELNNQLRAFFDVESLEEVPHLTFAAKRSDAGEPPAPSQLAWLFRVRQLAHEMPVPTYCPSRLKSVVQEMHRLLGAPEETRHVPRLLHDAGVRFVVV
jgi:HTH-type transcriptional regulator / antitoxin HigA